MMKIKKIRMLFLTVLATIVSLGSNAQIDLSEYNIDFNGDGSKATTNTSEFNKALSDAADSAVNLFVPPGTIELNGTLNVPAGIRISGSGLLATTLSWDNGFTGVGIEGTNFAVENVYIVKTGNSYAASAIRCNGGYFIGSFIQIMKMWDKGIYLNNCDSVEIGNGRILGSGGTTANIYVSNSSNVILRDIHSRSGKNGILVENRSSNITIKTFSLTNNDIGANFNGSTNNPISKVLMDGSDISGCYISSVVLKNVTDAKIKYVYGVVRNYDGSTPQGMFDVSGPKSENILLHSCTVNAVNELAPISGIRVAEGNNIKINYFSTNDGTAKPVDIKAAATNVLVNGVISRDAKSRYVFTEAPENVTIEGYTKQ